MTSEPHRLQYLDAMGLTAWTARYRLPNARESEACEWQVPDAAPAAAPGERLHALLDEAADAADSATRPAQESVTRPPSGPRKARALLGDLVPGGEPEREDAASRTVETATAPLAKSSTDATVDAPTALPAEALRFTWQVSCLDGRGLLLLPREAPVTTMEHKLLVNLLRAAGLRPESAPAFESFRWPPLEGLPMEAPLEEARDGLRAFLSGRRQRGWQSEYVLVFGDAEGLSPLLGLTEGHSELLSLPVWQAPDLGELAQSAELKRALWPRLQEARQLWQAATGEG